MGAANDPSVISLPKGGGAVAGLGEKFTANPFTGTADYSVPIVMPAGRLGVQPQLALAYSTGNGVGPFGLGWALSLPGVARKTSRGVPRYIDAAGPDAPRPDVFVLSGAEDLVQVAGSYPGRVRYRPRTEGLFARVEHVRDSSGDFWQVGAKNGTTQGYGTPRPVNAPAGWRDPAVVADPRDPTRVFGWRITQTSDPMGNLIRYEYLRDHGDEPGRVWDQPLIARIRYADYGDPAAGSFLVDVEFEYEARPDPHSDYRAGFEVRTSLRCKTIRVVTRAADGVARTLREYRLGYQQAGFSGTSLLTRIDVVGIDEHAVAPPPEPGPDPDPVPLPEPDPDPLPQPDSDPQPLPQPDPELALSAPLPDPDPLPQPDPDPVPPAEEHLPPLTFAYTGFSPEGRRFEPVTGAGLPTASLRDPTLALVDLRGIGLPDVVELGAVQRFWRNAGAGRFELPRPLALAPPYSLGDPGVAFLDADGDGRPDLVVSQAGGPAGYFPMTFATGWSARSFQPYRQAPAVSLTDPGVKLVDLDGDGLTDILRSGTRLECWFNDPDPRKAWQRNTFATGLSPDLDLADPRVRLADMTGDGLADLVLLHSGNVAYWPNLGHGRWGAMVAMRRSPRLPDGYDPGRVLLGDVDGDGRADLLYVDTGRVLLWGNQSGNGWTETPVTISGTPEVVDTDTLRLADLRGTGMGGLLFSRADDRSGRQLRFLDFTGEVKPYLLEVMDNHLGATTRVRYQPSTVEFLRDQGDPATRWRTTLPFPVHVVSKVEVVDEISHGRLTTEYRYHHGYWDGLEREFRGFAMVEQLDSEAFEDAGSPAHFTPPTLTKNWFHPGPVAAIEAGDWTELDLRHEYWPGDQPMLSRPPEHVTFLNGLSRLARRAALRTMRGQLLRSELYALDGSARDALPYTVTEALFGVRSEAPDVYFPFPLGRRTTQWERGDDPMTRFAFPAGYDAYGLATGQVDIAVPRDRDPSLPGTAAAPPYLATYATTEFARRDDADRYLVDRVARTTSHEVVNDGRLTAAGLCDVVLAGSASLRVIGHTRTFYDGEAFVGLPLGQLGAFGQPSRTESLAFTDGFLDPRPVYLNPAGVTAWPGEYPQEFRDLLPSLAGYRHYTDADVPGSPGGYYVVTARHRYNARGLPLVWQDPLGSPTTVEYDQHDLLPVRVTDAAGLSTVAVPDNRVLQPREVTDPNGTTTAVTFSPAGLVTAQFVRSKDGQGDHDVPGLALSYDLLAFADRGQPASVRAVRRVYHETATDIPIEQRDDVIVSVEYSDGFGRVLQTRSQAEDTVFGDPAFGGGVLPVDQLAPAGDTVGRTRAATDPPNVIVSGAQVYDNKGRVVQKFEPFFGTGFGYAEPVQAQLGQRTTIFYDPRGQAVRTVNPDGSELRVIFGVPVDLADPDTFAPTPWESYVYDANDNAGRTHAAAAQPYAPHWNTPASMEVDALGRTVRMVSRNGPADTDGFTTRSGYDIQGHLRVVTDALGRDAFKYTVDLAGRRWRMDSIDAGRHDTVNDALGNPVEGRDAKGALILGAFDRLHRPTRVWARDGAGGSVTLRRRIDYGDGGTPDQPATERDAARALNLLGRVVREHDEAGLVTTEAADMHGNVLRATRRVIADAPILAGYQQAAANGWQVVPFQVDWNQPDAALLEATGYTTTSSYDALNRIVTRTLPSDVEGRRRVLRPAYNKAGALEQVRLDDTVYVQRIGYDAGGRRVLIGYGNGVLTRYAYDPHTFRLARLRSEHYTLAGGATYHPTGEVLQDYGYECDLVGNIRTIRDRAPGCGIGATPNALNRAFEYDPTYRLLVATGREQGSPPPGDPWTDLPRGTDVTRTQPYQETYHYDAVGNLLTLAHGSAGGFTRQSTVEPGSNRLQSMTIGTTVYGYTYDANGNLTGETATRHFGWSHGDQLKTYATQTAGAEPSIHAQYLYDGAGRRVKKLVRRQGGAVEVTHYLDGLFEHHRWNGGANNHVHVMDDRQRIALVRIGAAHPDDGGPAIAYQLGDQIGSSTAVLDGTGVLTNREEFSPYGETSFGSYARKRYRFTGQERDEESGLSMHGARYYAPWLARWTSVDPVGLQGGTNLYAYCAAEPLALVDRDGRNFTVVIDFDKSTIVLGSVIVVRTEKDRAQVAAALDDFNKKAPAVNYNGMAVTFDVKVRLDPDDFGKVRPKPSEYRINEYNSERWGDRVPREVNSIPDNRGNFGYTGGVTRLARNITMTHHDNWGNLGGVPDFVKHEILHTFGLDDKGDPYYVAGGLMEPSVVFRFFGARDPQGANNVRLRKEEISMIMKFVDDYFPELTDPRSKYHVEATPIVDFVHSRAPGARVFSTFDAARADYLREINKSTLEGLPATPPPLPELPSTSKQPATNP